MTDSLEGKINFLNRVLKALILVAIAIFIGGVWIINTSGKADLPNFVANMFIALVTILMIAVIGLQAEIIGIQAEISRKQTEILELEKKPMLAFSKILPKYSRVSAKMIITNMTKYPVFIEKVEFVSQVEKPDAVDFEKRILEKLQKTVLQPFQQKELTMLVGGTIKLEVSNFYFRNIKAVYIYNFTEDRMELVEE
ncbi:hypothetical protein [Archaeoglobus sp.]